MPASLRDRILNPAGGAADGRIAPLLPDASGPSSASTGAATTTAAATASSDAGVVVDTDGGGVAPLRDEAATEEGAATAPVAPAAAAGGDASVVGIELSVEAAAVAAVAASEEALERDASRRAAACLRQATRLAAAFRRNATQARDDAAALDKLVSAPLGAEALAAESIGGLEAAAAEQRAFAACAVAIEELEACRAPFVVVSSFAPARPAVGAPRAAGRRHRHRCVSSTLCAVSFVALLRRGMPPHADARVRGARRARLRARAARRRRVRAAARARRRRARRRFGRGRERGRAPPRTRRRQRAGQPERGAARGESFVLRPSSFVVARRDHRAARVVRRRQRSRYPIPRRRDRPPPTKSATVAEPNEPPNPGRRARATT